MTDEHLADVLNGIARDIDGDRPMLAIVMRRLATAVASDDSESLFDEIAHTPSLHGAAGESSAATEGDS